MTTGAITRLDFEYEKKENKEKEITKHTKLCVNAAKSIPIRTLQRILPYSKEELRLMLGEDNLLNNLDWDKIWKNILKGIEDAQAPEFAALFGWRSEKPYRNRLEDDDKMVAKFKAIIVLKQAIRLYINSPD